MNDARLLDAAYVIDALASGATFFIGTHARIIAVKHKHIEAWAAAGKALLKSKDGHLYMRQGKGYVDVSYAHLELRRGGARTNPGRSRRNPQRRYDKKTGEPLRAFGYDLDQQGRPIRGEIDLKAQGDTGHDPLGNGMFRMYPSGDIVDNDERIRRMTKKNPGSGHDRRRHHTHRHRRSRRNGALGLTAADYERRGVPGFSGYNPRSAMGRRHARGTGSGRSAMLLGTLNALKLHNHEPCSRQALKGWYVGYIPEGKRLVLMRKTRREVPVEALSASVYARHRQFHEQAPRKAILYDLPTTKGLKEQVGLIESLTYVVPPSVNSPSKSGYRWVHAFGDHGESGHGEATDQPKQYPTHLMPALDVDKAGNISIRRRSGNKYDVTEWIYW